MNGPMHGPGDEGEKGFVSLFNGEDLTGWVSTPRVFSPLYEGGPSVKETSSFDPSFIDQMAENHARWTVEDGTIVGRQNAPGGPFGGFLVTEKLYGDFELRLEVKPEWPADSGIFVRKNVDSWRGVQVQLDHRKSGSIGSYYGNGLAAFKAASFNIDAVLDEDGQVVELIEETASDAFQVLGPENARLLTHTIGVDEFLRIWRVSEWNEFRIRVEGRLPKIETWINGVKVSAIDLAAIEWPHYDPRSAARVLGGRGQIALEVHETDPMLGAARWGQDAACRWRNIRVRELPHARGNFEHEENGKTSHE